LPAIAAILKTRRRKLAQVSSADNLSLIVNTDFATLTKASLDNINTKLNSLLDSNSSAVMSSINKNLTTCSIKSEGFREFNILIFTRTQITYLLYA